MKALADLVLIRSHFLLHQQPSFHCVLTSLLLWNLWCEGTNPIHAGSTLWYNHHPKAPEPNTITVNIRVQPMDLWWRRKWQPTPVLLPGEFHGWGSLVGYSPWGRKESDMTKQLHFLSIVPFGEGNGNPLQCSCLENPMDGGAWWAAVYGAAKSQTRLSN